MPSTVFAPYSVLVVPGWQNSGPEHWQSQWQAQQPDWQRVMQRDWLTPQLADWVAALDAAIVAATQPVLLVAHSLGCVTVAHWAQASVLVPVPQAGQGRDGRARHHQGRAADADQRQGKTHPAL